MLTLGTALARVSRNVIVQDARAVVVNNILWANGAADFFLTTNGGLAEAVVADHNVLSSPSAARAGLELGARNVRGSDPLFAGQDDLHLGERSPALDAGAARFTPALAYEGALDAPAAVHGGCG